MNGKRRFQMFHVIAALLKRCLTFHVIKTCLKRFLTLIFVLEALYPLITLILIQILYSYSSLERCGGAGALLGWSWRGRGAQNASTGELPGLKMPPRASLFEAEIDAHRHAHGHVHVRVRGFWCQEGKPRGGILDAK